MEPQAALGRPPRDVVLDAVALEDLDRAVIPLDREMDRELALRDPEHGTKAGLELDVVGRGIELGEGRREGAGSRGPATSGVLISCIKWSPCAPIVLDAVDQGSRAGHERNRGRT